MKKGPIWQRKKCSFSMTTHQLTQSQLPQQNWSNYATNCCLIHPILQIWPHAISFCSQRGSHRHNRGLFCWVPILVCSKLLKCKHCNKCLFTSPKCLNVNIFIFSKIPSSTSFPIFTILSKLISNTIEMFFIFPSVSYVNMIYCIYIYRVAHLATP